MLRNLAVTLLLAAAFALSLFYSGYQDPLQFPVLSLLAAAFLIALPRRAILLPASVPVFFLLGLCLLVTLAFTSSMVPFSSQIAFCIFCALPVTFFIATSVMTTTSTMTTTFVIIPPSVIASEAGQSSATTPGLPRFARNDDALIGILLTPLALLASWAILQHLTCHTRATGPLLDPNMLAVILTPGLICATGLAFYKRTAIITILALLLFAALLTTASRSGLLAAALGFAILIPTARLSLPRKHFIALAAAILIILALLGGSLWHQLGNIALASPSVTDRLDLWRAAWQMALAHPLLGSGPGTFHLYYPGWRSPTDQSLGIFAHSDLLQFAAELGLAAPLLIYGFFTAILWRTLSALRATTDNALRLAILTPFAALLTIAVQAHVNYPLFMLPVMMVCGILLAVWHRATAIALSSGELLITPPLPRRVLAAFTGLLLMACLLGLSFTASAGLYNMQKFRAATDPQTALIALGWADRLAPMSFIEPEVEIARTNLDLITKTGNITSPRLREDLLLQSARLLDAASYWNPAWAEIDYLRGRMEQIRDSKALMVTDWKTAIRKNPQHFQARRSLAEALRAEGRNDDAIKIVENGLNYPHTIAYREWASNFLRPRPRSPKQP